MVNQTGGCTRRGGEYIYMGYKEEETSVNEGGRVLFFGRAPADAIYRHPPYRCNVRGGDTRSGSLQD